MQRWKYSQNWTQLIIPLLPPINPGTLFQLSAYHVFRCLSMCEADLNDCTSSHPSKLYHMPWKRLNGGISLGFNLRLLDWSFSTKFVISHTYYEIVLKWGYNAHFAAGIDFKNSAAHVMTWASLVIVSLKLALVLAALEAHTNLSWLVVSRIVLSALIAFE